MKTRFQHDDLLYGVLLSALIAFAFATVLDGVHADDLAGRTVAAATAVVSAQTAASIVPATQAVTAR